MAQYQKQLERVQRYYDRFKRLNNGTSQTMKSDEYLDDIYAFFQNCHHLKDWLKNDSAFTKRTNSQIEKYIGDTQPLAICADICNASKHLQLKQIRRCRDEPKLGKKTISIEITSCLNGQEIPTNIAMQVEIEHDDSTLDAFQVATDAIQAWKSFV